MRRALDPEHDLIGDDEAPHDLVLGIPALLGIFVAAVLICAVCFGYGYSSGHGLHFSSAQPSQSSTPPLAAKPAPMPLPSQTGAVDQPDLDSGQTTSPSVQAAAPSYAKPSPEMTYQAPAAAVNAVPAPSQSATPAQTNLPARTTPQTSEYARTTAQPAPERLATPVANQSTKDVQAAPVPQAGSEPVAQSVGPPISLMVQIAAVTQFSDAQTLSTALRHDGFSPIVRTTTGDPYFHVQVGPFSSYEAAKAMRQRLASSGYSAFIRH
jgi:DedD protein